MELDKRPPQKHSKLSINLQIQVNESLEAFEMVVLCDKLCLCHPYMIRPTSAYSIPQHTNSKQGNSSGKKQSKLYLIPHTKTCIGIMTIQGHWKLGPAKVNSRTCYICTNLVVWVLLYTLYLYLQVALDSV